MLLLLLADVRGGFEIFLWDGGGGGMVTGCDGGRRDGRGRDVFWRVGGSV